MPLLLQPLWQGEKGVDAFFLVSAVVLGLPLFKRLDYFNLNEALTFYKKRLFRIYPLFLIALIIYTITQWSYFGKYFFSNLFLINNLIPGERTIIPVGWSLLVEVQYYAVLPLLFLALSRFKRAAEILIGDAPGVIPLPGREFSVPAHHVIVGPSSLSSQGCVYPQGPRFQGASLLNLIIWVSPRIFRPGLL